MKFHPSKLAEEITAEITRVSALRERVLRDARSNGTVGEARPRLYLMDQAMHFARRARESGDAEAMLMTLRGLRDFLGETEEVA